MIIATWVTWAVGFAALVGATPRKVTLTGPVRGALWLVAASCWTFTAAGLAVDGPWLAASISGLGALLCWIGLRHWWWMRKRERAS